MFYDGSCVGTEGASVSVVVYGSAGAVSRLVESVSPPDPYADMDDEAWIAELERRSADAEAGRAVCEDARKMIEDLRVERGCKERE
jgi:hypothetical protein